MTTVDQERFVARLLNDLETELLCNPRLGDLFDEVQADMAARRAEWAALIAPST